MDEIKIDFDIVSNNETFEAIKNAEHELNKKYITAGYLSGMEAMDKLDEALGYSEKDNNKFKWALEQLGGGYYPNMYKDPIYVGKELYFDDDCGNRHYLMEVRQFEIEDFGPRSQPLITVRGTYHDLVHRKGISGRSGRYPWSNDEPNFKNLNAAIKKVIFNYPATIIIWDDGTKTVVKCGEHDSFDKEKGLAMAICKKLMGNKGNFNNFFKKYLEETDE